MINFSIFYFNIIFNEFKKKKIDIFFISLGYRNSPISLSAIQIGKRKCVLSYDERSLGFFSLGYSKFFLKPSILIVTSGTALANLYPSIVESSSQFLPIIVLTSDRNFYNRANGENQVIDQIKIFNNFVKIFFDLNMEFFKIVILKYLLSTINYCYFKSLFPISGPVHLNFMISEPIHPIRKFYSFFNKIRKYIFFSSKNKRKFENIYSNSIGSDINLFSIFNKLSSIKFGLIIISDILAKDKKNVIEIINILKWPVYLDSVSGISYSFNLFYFNIYSLKFKNYSPDFILQIGGKTINKNFIDYLDFSLNFNYIILNSNFERTDNNLISNFCIYIDLSFFLYFLKDNKFFFLNNFIFINDFLKINLIINKIFFFNKDINDFFINRYLGFNLFNLKNIFISNSLQIRIFDFFRINYKLNNSIYVNRGANGIDGILSTGFGLAKDTSNSFFLLVGEISFLHDLNGLFFLRYIYTTFIITLINNNGCGIFTLLPVYQIKNIFSPYFEFRHNLNLDGIFLTFNFYNFDVKKKKRYIRLFIKFCRLNCFNLININIKNNFSYLFFNFINKNIFFYFNKDL